MSGSVLLLRAVNVGGHNRVPMAQLRELLAERTALTGVETYIASGNVLCDSPEDAAAVCTEVRTLIAAEYGVDTPVIHRTHHELVSSLAAQPFSGGDEKFVHVMFLEWVPAEGAVEALLPRLAPEEEIALAGKDLWITYSGDGVGSTKLTGAVLNRALGVAGTARNLRTAKKLAELTS